MVEIPEADKPIERSLNKPKLFTKENFKKNQSATLAIYMIYFLSKTENKEV